MVIGALTGCARHFHVSTPVVRLPRPPLVERLPVTVGVIYAADFGSYQHIGPPHGLIALTVEFGAASIAMFDQALAAMFERVVPIQPRSDAPPGLDAILDLSFERVTVCRGELRDTAMMYIEITYGIQLRTVEGEQIAAWSPTGTGTWSAAFLRVPSTASRLAEGAVRGAVAQFMISFTEPPAVKQWLEHRGEQHRAEAAR